MSKEAAAPEILILLQRSSILQSQYSSTGPLQLQQPRQSLSQINVRYSATANVVFVLPKNQCEHLDKDCLRRRDKHIKLRRGRGLDPFQPLHTTASVHLRRGMGVIAQVRTDPQHTLAGEKKGGGGAQAIDRFSSHTGVILSNPFRGSARIVSAVRIMRPALISILT